MKRRKYFGLLAGFVAGLPFWILFGLERRKAFPFLIPRSAALDASFRDCSSYYVRCAKGDLGFPWNE